MPFTPRKIIPPQPRPPASHSVRSLRSTTTRAVATPITLPRKPRKKKPPSPVVSLSRSLRVLNYYIAEISSSTDAATPSIATSTTNHNERTISPPRSSDSLNHHFPPSSPASPLPPSRAKISKTRVIPILTSSSRFLVSFHIT